MYLFISPLQNYKVIQTKKTDSKTNHHHRINKNKRLGIILRIYEEKNGRVDELLWHRY